jgi:DNA modification methylase
MPRIAKYLNRIVCGDALSILKKLPSESIDCVVTSPPYWSLRDYGVKGQIGLEDSFAQYLINLLAIFSEVRRVLKAEGTCWVNLGDTYTTRNSRQGTYQPALSLNANKARSFLRPPAPMRLPPKCLLQLPSRFALEMTSLGWTLRNEIIWHKPNCLPSSARDRFTVDFEKLFFFVKNRRYYFQQQFEPLSDTKRLMRPLVKEFSHRKRRYGDLRIAAINPKTEEASRRRMLENGRNKRCVWRIATRPFRGEHFAVFPQEFIKTPILAGCPEGGIVLDPFSGSGTTALVARRFNRRFVGIELNPKYVRMSEKRLNSALSS